VLQKVLAVIFVGVFVGKLLFKPQLRALGKKLDRLVNYILVAIAIYYAGAFLFMWLNSK
jgi:hypothetical protein